MKQMSAAIRRFLMAGAVTSILALVATAQTESILYSFTGANDGASPQAGLTPDGKGNYFGVAIGGGSGNAGVVFELSPNSSGGWTEQVIYNFTGYTNFSDGTRPSGTLVFDSKGNLYGVTEGGGVSGSTGGAGTVFELTPNSNGTWAEKILYSFAGGTDASEPLDQGLAIDSAGNLYGTTFVGGAYGYGAVYELVAGAGGTWTEKVLYSFKGLNDGAAPFASPLVLDSAGNLYGAAWQGGAHDYGVVYELSRGSGGVWTQKILCSFPGGSGGESPVGSLTFDSAGNLYGTAVYVAFELVHGSTGTWTRKILHRFAGGTDGADPLAGMVFDKAGNLYGMTSTGGAHRGVVYELIPAATGTWTEKILHRFASNGTDGYGPTYSNVTIDASGNVFGIAGGGSTGAGVIFEVKP